MEPSSQKGSLYEQDAQPTTAISALSNDADAFEKVIEDIRALEGRQDSQDNISGGFNRLVAQYLNSSERAAVGQSVKLDVAGTTWVDEVLTSEPQPIEGGDSKSALAETPDVVKRQHHKFHRETIVEDDQSSWTLESDEILRLLIQEFGPLTLGDEEEEVILEADGVFWLNGVIVVGVIHLTTHRLAFHASLLATQPEMMGSEGVIKAGSMLIRAPGSNRFKRSWVELSHDMMTVYNSSREEDRIRPRRSALLSNVRSVQLRTPTSLTVESVGGTCIAELDTTEATSEWRRELEGALFLDRHRRRETLTNEHSEDKSGIRMSCPLDKIQRVVLNQTNLNSLPEIHLEHSSDDVHTPEVLRMRTILQSDSWNRLNEYVALAKQRPISDVQDRSVIMDFGPFTFTSEPRAQDLMGRAPLTLEDKVRRALALSPEDEAWIVRARVIQKFCYSGSFVVTARWIGFWSKALHRDDIRYRLPTSIIKVAQPHNKKIPPGHSLILKIEGYSDLRFQFRAKETRDEAIRRINAVAGARRTSSIIDTLRSTSSNLSSKPSSETSSLSDSSASTASTTPSSETHPFDPQISATGVLSPQARTRAVAYAAYPAPERVLQLPKSLNINERELHAFPRKLHVVCLTIGSRGDVQPYIALGVGLKKQQHRVTIVTHAEYKNWIEGFGIEHRTAGGDPGALMKLSVENKMFSPDFFRESISNFRPWLDNLLVESWEACQGADVLLESPSAMAGVHIAEALHIPYFRTFTMPWSKTVEFPHPFLSPPVDSHVSNSVSHVLFNNVMWAATSGQINRWRTQTLKIGPTDNSQLVQSKILHIYNFSEAVVPKPLDWGDTISISGYWFLDNPDLKWTPPQDLLDFLDRARLDGKPVVYIGFGSITIPHPNRVTARIIKAVQQSGVRTIIGKGWSSRLGEKETDPEPEIPKECYMVDSIPHDWLFPKIDAALHHGGAGTTGASLRAGIPTLIKPWFGDQFFWASRVQKLGAGLRVPSLQVNDLAAALTKATTNIVMKERAAIVGEKIRSEDGVTKAIQTMYTYLHLASQDRKSTKKKTLLT